jgi:hypothetical protein
MMDSEKPGHLPRHEHQIHQRQPLVCALLQASLLKMNRALLEAHRLIASNLARVDLENHRF